jgi:hypothetical protein
MSYRFIAAAAFATFSILSLSHPAQALTSRECSARYKAAQSSGTTGGMKYACLERSNITVAPGRAQSAVLLRAQVSGVAKPA